ncbi:MAG: DNA_ligase_IV_Ku-like [uncultured Chthoniobacterales bacterium]|uniref:DNA ligase (ATP) n=1 Tax=uncultured Chthoniobacterales bacterium TaxID=1836801 RepID=A0A6J4J6Z9_9BACT|nr:MAG: DNA_ligase_IV_Ku-like [uncultured Chthoniobacterales bacterium]
MGLKEYKRKRNFGVTAEPAGGKPLPKAVKGASRFVIQKHDATRLHYDFRLEMEGVLKSWAVPKGLPWGKGEKHLAVEVEDHPVEYETFEGVIPKGQYGGGTVMVWDRGTYYVYGEDPLQALKDGRMHIVLHGEKAHGEWALIRTRMDADKPQWLLLKATESLPPISKKLDDQSVKTGRTMQQIADERDAEWQSNRGEAAEERERRSAAKDKKKTPAKSPSRRTKSAAVKSDLAAELKELPAGKPRFVVPMKPKLLEEAPTAGDWVYELKFDGFRIVAVKNGDKVNLVSRNGNELAARFPETADAVRALPVNDCVIDGEVVALDEQGRSSFQLLQGVEMESRRSPTYYYVFDLLQAEGRSLTGQPLEFRKEMLQRLCGDAGEAIRYSGDVGSDAEPLLKQVQQLGLEGLIGKQRGSVYEEDRRSGLWIKLKVLNQQEFVIGGYTPPGGSRKHFGALLVGYYEGKKLLFAGKVGTGFNAKLLAALHKQFKAEERADCPFADLPSKQGGQWVQGITPAMMRRCTWVNPVFVCQLKFAEWTRDAKLRQPVFLGMREDKDARQVTRSA